MRKKEIRLILSCCAVSVAAIMVAFTAFAATLNVGDYPYPPIQNAIADADPGDTVLAAPITYTETDISFMNKAITVECDGSPGSCVVDCDLNDGDYGFIFDNDEGSNSVLKGFTIQNANFAGIRCNGSSPTITDCTMRYNGYGLCGGFEALASSPTLSGCTITHNSGQLTGGACFLGGSPTLSGCNITYNSSAFNDPQTAGGAVFMGDGSPTVTGGSISWNTAWGAGGVYNAENPASLTMTGVTISYNSGYDVGGMLSVDSSPTLTGCTVSYNTNFWWATDPELGTGGVHFIGGSPTITGGTVTYNSGWYVGGIANWDSPASLSISGCAVTLNSGYYTGGIETWNASPTISNCNVSYNGAWGDPGAPYSVGGVGTFGGSPTITGGNVSFNSAWFGVGGIRCTESIASPTISGVTIDNNEGAVAGGITFFRASGTIEDCNVTSNVATGCGGGCHVGGIAVVGDGDVNIDRTYVSQNEGWTGGIGSVETNSPSVTNSMITGNTGLFIGGISCDNAEISLMNCTVADNDGNTEGAGGIGGNDFSPITVINSILWGNTPNQVDTGVAPTVAYSDVQGGHAGTGNINADPMFLGPGDYHIFLASPCVDVGTADGAPADDIDGDVRPQGAGIDMGADENLPDDDGDGVPSAYEMGPDLDPGYDGNDDGVPDWTQGNVSSFPTVDGGNYVTIECPDPSFFVNVAAAPNPSPSNTPPGVTFPYGFFSFRINNLPTGGATTVTIHLSGPVLDDYWKYGRTPDDPANHWYLFPIEEDADGDVTGAENIGDTTTRLHFVDGKRGDNDLTANGTVIDPGAPGVPGAADVFNPETIEDKSDSVCFIGTAADSFGF